MDNLYDIKFQSNGEFCKICISYNVIYSLLVHYASLKRLVHIRQSRR
jgi:hypothetical protein